ncbi:MAG: LPXTG cell wall anchor domain-containing protein, partial [Oscillospiraceae bacterium]|nr:LPXTG cell wall anchor domain-containing protein [Oscillospiraceae bacterium]
DVKLVVEAATANRQDWTEVDDYKLPEHALTGLTLTVDGKESSALAAGEELGRNGTSDTGVNKGLVWTQVVNKEGSSLPSTGGIGTTLFYVIGGTLAAGAGVGLIAKKRMKNEE